jgi:hypothetical protein
VQHSLSKCSDSGKSEIALRIIVARDGGMEAVARTMAVRVRIGVFARGTRIWNETQ